MTKKWWQCWFKFKIPSEEELKKNKYLRIFGSVIHAGYLWHFHRRNVAKAVAIGLFCCCMPMPFQMIPATALAILWRAHLPISIAMVWISNPITMPFMMVLQYHIGASILTTPDIIKNFKVSVEWFSDHFHFIWQPLLLGAVIMGAILSVLGYFGTKYIWRFWLIRKWQRRHRRIA